MKIIASYPKGTVMILACILFAIGIIRKGKKQYYLSRSLQKIDRMSGIGFERYLKYQFKKQGFRVKMTPVSGDFGADLIIRKWHKKTIIQVKRYQGTVGIQAVQEAIGAREYYRASGAMVVTNSYFTKAAVELAKASDVKLWSRDDLIEQFKLKDYRKKQYICPKCKGPLVIRDGKFGLFYGCSNYPACRYTKDINSY